MCVFLVCLPHQNREDRVANAPTKSATPIVNAFIRTERPKMTNCNIQLV